jgi:hypothetical protein
MAPTTTSRVRTCALWLVGGVHQQAAHPPVAVQKRVNALETRVGKSDDSKRIILPGAFRQFLRLRLSIASSRGTRLASALTCAPRPTGNVPGLRSSPAQGCRQ